MDIFNEFFLSFSPSQSGYFFMWILTGIALAALIITVERWFSINWLTNVDAGPFVDQLTRLIKDKKINDAVSLCLSGHQKALPRIIGAGVGRAENVPEMIRSSMEAELLYVIPRLEKRMNLIATSGNIATLIGLMGTIYGLILAFAAVAQPDVSPVEKSSLLAIGISAAMNTTLLGLIIAVPCVTGYSILRSKIDDAIAEIDLYAVTIIKALTPDDVVQKSYRVSDRRLREEVETDPDMTPFMNLMVVLIPLLLSQSEFVKLGMIELKLPESTQGGGGGGDGESKNEVKLDLGIAVTAKGFNLYHYFKQDTAKSQGVEIPMKNGEYDLETLNKKLAIVKQKALFEIIKSVKSDLDPNTPIEKLYAMYTHNHLESVSFLNDHESLKIVAEDKIKYQVVISVMDAARGFKTDAGTVTMFSNVSIAGGIIQ
jgi:biopolymer transport protein ExbB/TolQ/biopolymer transport protein ExbD